jgi:hypothetical protein
LNVILKNDNLEKHYLTHRPCIGYSININLWILLSLFIALFALFYPQWRRKTITKRWHKALNLDQHHPVYEQLYKDTNGFILSREARAEHDAIEYTYGEIDFIPFIALLSLTKPDEQTVFYDLGSGAGKAVLACAMVFNVQKSCGIEIFTQLHHAALTQKQRLLDIPNYKMKAAHIDFINMDFLQADISDATLIFINATALFGETWLALNEYLLQVKPHTTIITTSKKLSSDAFVVRKTTTVQMSWGLVDAYIQHRC